MTNGFSRAKKVDVLLATLVGERHVRHSLLCELADELQATPGLDEAALVARRLALAAPTEMAHSVFIGHVHALAALVRACWPRD